MTTSNGLLLVDKPRTHQSRRRRSGRRILGERRIGHAGTLDPMATGCWCWPSVRRRGCCVSPSPRLSATSGTVTFGVATDSLDADGAGVEERTAPALDAPRSRAAAARR